MLSLQRVKTKTLLEFKHIQNMTLLEYYYTLYDLIKFLVVLVSIIGYTFLLVLK